MEFKTISVKAPVDLIEEVDGLVRAESEQIGLPVDRSGFVLRAIRNDVENRKALLGKTAANDNAKGRADA